MAWIVAVMDPLHPDGISLLRGTAGIEVREKPGSLRDAHALIVRSATRVTAAMIDSAPALRVIARSGAGLDNVDADAAARRGIALLHAAEAVTESTAELAFGLLLAAARRIPQADAALRQGRWEKGALGTRLAGKTLGVVGFGRVGQAVGARAEAFRMRVLGHDPARKDSVPLDRLLAESDAVSVHVPLLPETRGLIGAEALGRMKRGAILVQCSRGGVVDEAALAEALRRGHLAAAALDVFEAEPLPAGHPLLSVPNLVCTPHVGAATAEAQAEAARLVAARVRDFLLASPPAIIRSP